MTFILAIQLEDSIIVTTDNRIAALTEDGQIKNTNDELTKFYLWDKGIITGSGEYIVIQTAVELFKNISGSKIAALPKCLQISRMIRELKVEHFQIATSKLIYSEELENRVQLNIIEPNEVGEYRTLLFKTNEIILWMFEPDVSAIIPMIKNLYATLKPRQAFLNREQWFDYYINSLCEIYKTQSQHDPLMSQSFDFIFQSREDYMYGHVQNTDNRPLKFIENFPT